MLLYRIMSARVSHHIAFYKGVLAGTVDFVLDPAQQPRTGKGHNEINDTDDKEYLKVSEIRTGCRITGEEKLCDRNDVQYRGIFNIDD